ncbi:MAG: diguanylate cyclase domain-containing protein [Oleiphilus sp.]
MTILKLNRLLSILPWVFFFFGLNAWSLEPVTLQLKWQHQFQFAGYYAALEKGYYRDLGLDVTLKEAQPYQDPVQNVLEGKAEFGVGTSELMLLHHYDQPVLILAVIFQHSPLALLVPKPKVSENEIQASTLLSSLAGQAIMMEANSAELLAYLSREGLTKEKLNLIDHSFDVQNTVSGEAAAMSVYVTDEPYLFQQANLDYHLFRPIMAGIDFYGDNLFTTQKLMNLKPQLVHSFRKASLKGWQYAMAHPEEIIDLIYNKYPNRHSREHLAFEAKQMLELMSSEIVEVGYMNESRWQHIGNTYAQLNMLPYDFELDGFLYKPSDTTVNDITKENQFISVLVSALVVGLIAVFWHFNRLLRKKAAWLNTVLKYAPSALMILDKDAKVLKWNKQAEDTFGWTADETMGKPIYEFLIPLPNQTKLKENFNRAFLHAESQTEHFWSYTKSGKMILCDWKNAPLESDKIVAMVSDVTQQKEMQDKLNQMAHSDSLTGVANRTLFFQKLDEAISLAKRRKEKVALLFIDLDDFKIVNDQYGHEFGDVVLCEVVQRIKMAVREADTLARIGGDEFVLILYDCETNERAMQVAEKVLFHLERPIQVSGLTVIVGGSIGISFYPDDGKKTTELLKSADRAMYEVKQKQKNGIGLASNALHRH